MKCIETMEAVCDVSNVNRTGFDKERVGTGWNQGIWRCIQWGEAGRIYWSSGTVLLVTFGEQIAAGWGNDEFGG